jgi:glucose-1-phosphate adenylyltransferase
VENFHANLEYLRFSRQKYVVIAGSEAFCNYDFPARVGISSNCHADVTVVYSKRNCKEMTATGADAGKDHCGRIWDMHVSGRCFGRTHGVGHVFIGARALTNLIEATSARGGYEFNQALFD